MAEAQAEPLALLRKAPPGRPFQPGNPFAKVGAAASVAARAAAKAAAAHPQPFQLPQPPTPSPDAVAVAVQQQLSLVARQIAHTCAVLDRAATHHCKACGKPSGAFLDMEPHHRAALLRALDQLLDRQRVLLAIPLPGSLKPSGKPARPPRAGLGDARAEAEPGQAAGAALG